MEFCKEVYGFSQVGCIAKYLLTGQLEPKGYFKFRNTQGLWRQKWGPILFSLAVEHFGVKYFGKEHDDHLISAIRKLDPVDEDWTGSLYCGIKLKWDNQKQTVDGSIPVYLEADLHKYQQ